MNTTSRQKSFIFGPATKWNKSSSKPIRQPRFVSEKERPVERRKRDYRYQIADLRQEHELPTRGMRPLLIRLGYRSLLAVPLLRDKQIMGALTVIGANRAVSHRKW